MPCLVSIASLVTEAIWAPTLTLHYIQALKTGLAHKLRMNLTHRHSERAGHGIRRVRTGLCGTYASACT